MKLTPELIQSYYDAEFHVFYKERELILPSMGNCDSLQALHDEYGVRSSALITAYNPLSEPTPVNKNQEKQRLLKVDVSKSWKHLEAEGCDTDKRWCSEPSIYVLGISLLEALKLGRCYQQHAVLYALGTKVNLYACDPILQHLFKTPA